MAWSLFLMMAPCNPLITFSLGNPFGRRNPANQLRLVVYLIIYRVLYIPHGCFGFLNHQQYVKQLQETHVKLHVSSQDAVGESP